MSDVRSYNRILRQICGLLLAMGLLLAGAVTAKASSLPGAGTSGDTGSLYLTYEGHSDVEFWLYPVGTTDADGKFVLESPYSDYGVTLDDTTVSGLVAAAKTLGDYITRDGIEPVATAVTDEFFEAEFTGLAQGAYLLLGDPKKEDDGYTYIPTPTLFSIPGLGQDGRPSMSVVQQVKFTRYTNVTELMVEKIWRNDTDQERPGSIVVELLKDGEYYDEYTLTADGSEYGSWKYQWNGLDADSVYTIVEKEVPAGYTVVVTATGTEIVVVNTKDKPDEPDEPDEPDKPDTPDEPDKPHLPQTGQLWWPILFMIAGGLFLILMGLIVRKRK